MLIDSNILIYSINSASPKHKDSQRFMQKNVGKLVVAHQNIFETLRVLTHSKFSSPMKSNEAIRAINKILNSCKIISPDYKTHQIALELIKKYAVVSNQIFDAYLVATAISNGTAELATDNSKDLQIYTEISVINPFL